MKPRIRAGLVNISGYAFGEKQTPNGFLPDYDELEGAVAAYLHGLYGDSPYPVRVLIQWSRVSGRVEASFEDEDESRWKVTPQNYLVAREELRPKLAPTPTESQSDRTRRVSGEVFVWGN